MEKGIHTRFAPSPTGALHVGGARTALFNYLVAQKQYGKFILRSEDSDLERNKSGCHLEQESLLKALGIFPDESFSNPGSLGPYLQSQKIEKYGAVAKELLNNGMAYRCFCTTGELELERKRLLKEKKPPYYSKKCLHLDEKVISDLLEKSTPFCLRLKMDLLSEYSWEDLIRGKITFPVNTTSDPVILRSNGVPTYNFAVVIDDIDMDISCVLRGEEHISNTASQLAVYHCLNKKPPLFGHLPILISETGKKLSKRDDETNFFIEGLLSQGYYPYAITNFLASLGWSDGQNREILSMPELIESFDVARIGKSSISFDIKKLDWFSHCWFQQMEDGFYLNFVAPFLMVDESVDKAKLEMFSLACKKSICRASEISELAKEFFLTVYEYTDAQLKILRDSKGLLELALANIPSTKDWGEIGIRSYLKFLSQRLKLSGSRFFKPLRLSMTNKESGFELWNAMVILGKEKCHQNLKKACEIL